MPQYDKFVVINAQTGGAAHWTCRRRFAEDRARALARQHGGRYIVARVLAYTEVTVVENK